MLAVTDPAEITVVKMGQEGSELLAGIYARAFKNSPEQHLGIKEFQSLFAITGTVSYVICRDDMPIGFILLRTLVDEAEIITFCILPKWCKNGYATYLLEWIINSLQQQSVKRLFLEVRENNEAAIRLYDKCSFKIIGRRTGYYRGHQGENIDALVMQIQLPD